MKTLFQRAVELAKQGLWDQAWEVAKKDDGLLPDCTFELWKEFVSNVINDEGED